MFLYGAIIALSAFLLFEVQPIIAKIILPWFGGSAAVWTTALMFFQFALLAGYIYSYLSTRYLKPRTQGVVHAALLASSLLLLPIMPSPSWKTGGFSDPTLRILLLLAASIGLPYFMLSTTGPLLQAWYAAARPGKIPYRLFALSNAGSMIALISFPVLVEPFLSSRSQAVAWSIGYAVFALSGAALALFGVKTGAAVISPEAPAEEPLRPTRRAQLLWIALPACASALLLAFSTHLTQNVAPIPFLWVLPLALYLLTFILCFESDKTYWRPIFIPLLAILLVAMSVGTYYSFKYEDKKIKWAHDSNLDIQWAIPLFSIGLFVCCMVCHGEMARLKPHPRYLTKFYLSLALGGAIGGLFVAVAAPRIFDTYLEIPISLVVCAALTAVVLWPSIPRLALQAAAATFVFALAFYLIDNEISDRQRFIASTRNFYGVLRVMDQLDTGEATATRKLINGTIVHGAQLTDPQFRREATSYYGPKSGVGRAIALAQENRAARVGVVGLGAGVLASYCRPADTFHFYEINPLDVAVANRYFTFLKDCPGCTVLPGDARLVMEQEAPQRYDVLAVDAFSSDAIPVHLLTREAFAVFIKHLKPDGILAIHVSNRYLDLAPIVARDADQYARPAFEVSDEGNDMDYFSASNWMLVGADTHVFVLLGFRGAPIVRRGAPVWLRTWTDDFSNLYQILR